MTGDKKPVDPPVTWLEQMKVALTKGVVARLQVTTERKGMNVIGYSPGDEVSASRLASMSASTRIEDLPVLSESPSSLSAMEDVD